VEAVGTLLRLFSYLYHGLLALFLLLVSALALVSGASALRLDMLPWSGATLAWILVAASLCGLAALALAIARRGSALFFLWSLTVAAMLLKGYVFSSFRFAAGAGVPTAVVLVLGSWLALPGAWFAVRRRQTTSAPRTTGAHGG
jgi:FtsH-binding integral membrane protein